MKVWPLKFREMGQRILFSDDSGSFFVGTTDFLEHYVTGDLRSTELDFLKVNGHAFEAEDDLEYMAFATRWARRIHVPEDISYVILVPTLRCDLNCDYCQVSRVNEHAKGFDWNEDRVTAVIEWLKGLNSKSIKVEFQGGEPLLRLDLLSRIREFCRQHFVDSQFVVCTNLQNVSDDAWRFFRDQDTFISTSFDGTAELHTLQRTGDDAKTSLFRSNVLRAVRDFGRSKVSALPTIDPMKPPDPKNMIRAFEAFGIRTIFLRRINYQGFARKKYDFHASTIAWREYYRKLIFTMIDLNNSCDTCVEEYYMSHLLKRILQGGRNGHVDLRSPGWLAKDYILIDYDGKFYPTDEARMVTRIGKIDLSVGSLVTGIDQGKISILNAASINQLDSDCAHCVYQQYCGLNIIDDLSRYGRVDMPRHLTDHCQHHLFLFDLAFELLYSNDPAVRKSVSKWLHLSTFPQSIPARIG